MFIMILLTEWSNNIFRENWHCFVCVSKYIVFYRHTILFLVKHALVFHIYRIVCKWHIQGLRFIYKHY